MQSDFGCEREKKLAPFSSQSTIFVSSQRLTGLQRVKRQSWPSLLEATKLQQEGTSALSLRSRVLLTRD